tara:strand:- start:499 stop:831 length:333 start_codon:yes stop_codon:yes gene_type:complete
MITKKYIIDFNPAAVAQRFSLALAGSVFSLRIYKSSRTQKWYFSLYNNLGVAMLEGRRIVTALPMLYGYRAEDRPAGALMALSTTQNFFAEPSGNNLGEDIKIFFYDRIA